MAEIALQEGYAAVRGHLGTLEGYGVREILECLGRFGKVQPSVAILLVIFVDEAEEEVILGLEGIDHPTPALAVSALVLPQVHGPEPVSCLASDSAGKVLGLGSVGSELPDVIAVYDKDGLVVFQPFGRSFVSSRIG